MKREESGISKHLKPNFLIVGAAKAGTTSLANYLNSNNEIFIPEAKELRYFIGDIIAQCPESDPLKAVLTQYSVLGQEYFDVLDVKRRFVGEASVHYLYHHEVVIPRVLKQVGDIPIIIMLRNPVDRAISNIKYLYGLHGNSVEIEWLKEPEYQEKKYNSFWYYRQLGLYHDQVAAYLRSFSKVKVIIFEEFLLDPEAIVHEVCDFLGADRHVFRGDVYNQTFIKRPLVEKLLKSRLAVFTTSKLQRKYIRFLKRSFRSVLYHKGDKVSDSQRKLIHEFYKEDIGRLEDLLGKNLDIWRNKRW